MELHHLLGTACSSRSQEPKFTLSSLHPWRLICMLATLSNFLLGQERETPSIINNARDLILNITCGILQVLLTSSGKCYEK